MAKPKSTVRVGVSKKTGKIVTTKKGSGLVDKILKGMGK
jgi:hypothetical protein